MTFTEYHLSQCLDNNPKAQRILYKKYSVKMYGICLRFARNKMDADDILQEGFIKVFSKLQYFRNEGSFEGWIRKIMINTSINFYKRKYPYFKDIDFETFKASGFKSNSAIDEISQKEILQLVDDLPKGYRTVFNLNAIEGYSHKEIGEKLNISSNTSKSQLTRAKNSLQNKLCILTQTDRTQLVHELCVA
ncbi:MAG: sigma-70 family RNA polymerase sigma factor [Bacteroidales bacterium]|nr:sigma-70 family RNA polymerase sigma factor [Bacteroidales bacterium]